MIRDLKAQAVGHRPLALPSRREAAVLALLLFAYGILRSVLGPPPVYEPGGKTRQVELTA